MLIIPSTHLQEVVEHLRCRLDDLSGRGIRRLNRHQPLQFFIDIHANGVAERGFGFLRDGSIDFYLGAAPRSAPAPGLVMQHLFDNIRAVVCRKGHPLAASRTLRTVACAEQAYRGWSAFEDADFEP